MNNAEQIDYWNGEAGQRWAAEDARMARMLQPVTAALLDHLAPQVGERALDIGCGGGGQTLLLAERLGGTGSVLGIDISAPMLAVARGKFTAVLPEYASV
ncbi:MAG: methyltransferase domain-containing protein, partial [Halioglobus sp.]|nr:methyltransferase domain-containing protein [Halioglobus sp.]